MEIRNTPLTDKIATTIRGLVASKKLSDKKIKDFLKKYYDGDPSNTCPNGCKADCLVDCYITIHQAMVSDDNKEVPFGKFYKRDNAYHCCGMQAQRLGNGNRYCIVCGNESK